MVLFATKATDLGGLTVIECFEFVGLETFEICYLSLFTNSNEKCVLYAFSVL